MSSDDLSEPEAAIVDLLHEDRATTGYMAAESGYSTAHLNTQLRVLLAKGLIRKVHAPTALYESSEHVSKKSIDTPTADLSAPETAIVDVLRTGRATTGYLADEVDYSRSHLNTTLRVLLAKGIIRNVHSPTALYELIENGMKTATNSTTDESGPDT